MKKLPYGIIRVESPRFTGYVVRLYAQGVKNPQINKAFSDSVHDDARSSAIAFRLAMLSLYPYLRAPLPVAIKAPPKPKISEVLAKHRSGNVSRCLQGYIKWGPGYNEHAATKVSLEIYSRFQAESLIQAWLKPWLKKQADAYGARSRQRDQRLLEMTEVNPIKEIHRVTGGWWVKISSGKHRVSRTFPDSYFSGPQEARDFAQWFTAKWKRMPKHVTKFGTITWTVQYVSSSRGYREVWQTCATPKPRAFIRGRTKKPSVSKTFRRPHGSPATAKASIEECRQWLVLNAP